jgi:hypothetical protein
MLLVGLKRRAQGKKPWPVFFLTHCGISLSVPGFSIQYFKGSAGGGSGVGLQRSDARSQMTEKRGEVQPDEVRKPLPSVFFCFLYSVLCLLKPET